MIATGGSVVYKSQAMHHLAENSMVVYLAIDLDTLKTRLSDVITRGVAIAPGKSIDDLYLERVPLYEKYADLTVRCGKNILSGCWRRFSGLFPPDIGHDPKLMRY